MTPGHRRPAIVAHSAGNGRRSTRAALDAGADFLEVDLWVHRGRLEVRHERRAFFPIPLLFERWYLKLVPRRPFRLEAVLDAAAGQAGVYLDLKNSGEEAAPLVREALAAAHGAGPVLASSQSWPALRALREECPDIRVLYSVDVREKLDLLFQVLDRGDVPFGVSCRHTLLSRETVDRLTGQGLAVVAWTVNDAERARELASWGVAAITTDDVRGISAALST